MVERNDSAINLGGATALAHSTIDVPSHPPLTASSAGAAACPSVALAFEDSGSRSSGDEVTIVVGRRKNSTTKAVRYLTYVLTFESKILESNLKNFVFQ